jgi:hypothetical protein
MKITCSVDQEEVQKTMHRERREMRRQPRPPRIPIPHSKVPSIAIGGPAFVFLLNTSQCLMKSALSICASVAILPVNSPTILSASWLPFLLPQIWFLLLRRGQPKSVSILVCVGILLKDICDLRPKCCIASMNVNGSVPDVTPLRDPKNRMEMSTDRPDTPLNLNVLAGHCVRDTKGNTQWI